MDGGLAVNREGGSIPSQRTMTLNSTYGVRVDATNMRISGHLAGAATSTS